MADALVQCGQSRGEAFDTVYTTARGAEEAAESAQEGEKRRRGGEDRRRRGCVQTDVRDKPHI